MIYNQQNANTLQIMSNYRRSRDKGATYFFTVVTHQRQAFLTRPEIHPLLREAILHIRGRHPFEIDAWVLLPDHMHCIWTLPQGDDDYSKRWNQIKGCFSRAARPLLHNPTIGSLSRLKRRESTVWQRRFLEHRVRDEADYQRHCDYIHYNPVKHGHVQAVADWPFSTFHRFVRRGIYTNHWGCGPDEGHFGE